MIHPTSLQMNWLTWRCRVIRVGRLLGVILLAGVALIALLKISETGTRAAFKLVFNYPGFENPSPVEQVSENRYTIASISSPKISCVLEAASGTDGAKQSLTCQFTFDRRDPISAQILTGEFGLNDLLREFLSPMSRSQLYDDKRPTNYTVTTVNPSATDAAKIHANFHILVRLSTRQNSAETEIQEIDASRSASVADWEIRLKDFYLDQISEGSLIRERNETSVRISAGWNTGLRIVRTPPSSDESAQISRDPILSLVDSVPFNLLVGVTPFALFAVLSRKRATFFQTPIRSLVVTYLIGATAITAIIFYNILAQPLTIVGEANSLQLSILVTFLCGWLWCAAAPVSIAILRYSKGVTPVVSRRAAIAIATAIPPVAFGACILVASTDGSLVEFAIQAGVTITFATLAAVLARNMSFLSAGIALGALSFVGATAYPLVYLIVDTLSVTAFDSVFLVLLQITCGIPVLMLVRHSLLGLPPHLRWLRVTVCVVTVFSTVSVPDLIGDIPALVSDTTEFAPYAALSKWSNIYSFVFLIYLLRELYNHEQDKVPYLRSSPIIFITTSTAIVVSSLDNTKYNWYVIAAQTILPFLVFFLIQHRRSSHADRLGRVNYKTHHRVIRAEVNRRRVSRAVTALLRSSHTLAAEKDTKWSEITEKVAEAESLEGPRPTRSNYLSLTEASLGSNGGATRMENLKAGAFLGFLISIPLAALELTVSALNEKPIDLTSQDTIELLSTIRILFRGVIYGALTGYFYPLLRGSNPVQKFGSMLIVVAITEMVAFSSALNEPDSTLPTGIFRLGTLIIFFLVMGLLWERRITVLANVPWTRLRDFRSLRALGTPATTVIIAGATVLITALAGALIAPLIQQPPISPPAGGGSPQQVQDPGGTAPATSTPTAPSR
jgi:hypothetical protein